MQGARKSGLVAVLTGCWSGISGAAGVAVFGSGGRKRRVIFDYFIFGGGREDD